MAVSEQSKSVKYYKQNPPLPRESLWTWTDPFILVNSRSVGHSTEGQTVLLDGPKKWVWWIRGLFMEEKEKSEMAMLVNKENTWSPTNKIHHLVISRKLVNLNRSIHAGKQQEICRVLKQYGWVNYTQIRTQSRERLYHLWQLGALYLHGVKWLYTYATRFNRVRFC